MKKASIEIGVNFLVVLIICLVLLGIGVKLMVSFISSADKLRTNVEEYNKAQIKKNLDSGALVAALPSSIVVQRGGYADFDIGISNELGAEQSFHVFVAEDPNDGHNVPDIKKLYVQGPYSVKNNAQYFMPVRIVMPRAAPGGTYIFDVVVCTGDQCFKGSSFAYGDLIKIYVNVR